MVFFNILIGLLIIAIGFLVKAYPNLIAGYNTMVAERKEKVDIDGLSTFLRNGLILTGLVQIGSVYLLKALGLGNLAMMTSFLLVIMLVIGMVTRAERFDPHD